MPKIHFLDVTNRDGVQTSRISLAKLQKTMINIYLGRLGIYQSEVGFPFVRLEQNYIQGNMELQELGVMGTLRLGGWCRAIVKDVQEGIKAGMKHLNLSISTSDQMITHKFRGRLDRERVIQEMVDATRCAKEGGIEGIAVNAEDASRTDMNYLIRFATAAKEAGAQRLRYCDTLGYDTPRTFYDRVKFMAENVGIAIEPHCHNDLGMAVASSVVGAQAALDGGVDAYINTTINGIGERAGQADLLGCILACKLGAGTEAYPIGDNIDLSVAWELANYTSRAFRIPIAINQPGVGANAFAHESGIHADGALKDHRNYELYDYQLLGIPEFETTPTGRVITTGEHGGISGFRHVCDNLGISFPNDDAAQQALEVAQYANAHTQQPLTESELRLIAAYPEQVRKIITLPRPVLP